MENANIVTGEKDINALFGMLKEQMPIPDEHVKDAVLNMFTYLLTM